VISSHLCPLRCRLIRKASGPRLPLSPFVVLRNPGSFGQVFWPISPEDLSPGIQWRAFISSFFLQCPKFRKGGPPPIPPPPPPQLENTHDPPPRHFQSVHLKPQGKPKVSCRPIRARWEVPLSLRRLIFKIFLFFPLLPRGNLPEVIPRKHGCPRKL